MSASVHSTSKIASTSTAALSGSEAVPTAERACLPRIAERRDQKIGRAVGDQMLLDKVRRGGDEDGDLHQPSDLFEIAECGLGLRQYVDRAVFCRLLAGCGVDVAAEQAARLRACRP